MSDKKTHRGAFLFRDSAAARDLPVLAPTGNPMPKPGEPVRGDMPDPWYLGYATALAEIWRLHHDGQLVRHILTARGLTLKHLERGGVGEYDLAAIRDACLDRQREDPIFASAPVTRPMRCPRLEHTP